MVEDDQLRMAERVQWHLSEVEKTFKVDKQKEARDLLLEQSLASSGRSSHLEAVKVFREDKNVLSTFKKEASHLLQGHESRTAYNMCLGLLTARLMFW